MGFLVAALYGVSISVPEHTTTTRIGLSIWGFVVLAVVVVALILGFVSWRRRRHRGTARGGTS